MDVRIVEISTDVEELAWSIDEVRLVLEMALQTEEEIAMGAAISVGVRDLQRITKKLEHEAKTLQKINGVGKSETDQDGGGQDAES